MFRTIQFLVYLRYLNLNKQLISIKDSHMQSSTFWFCALPSLLFSYLAGCNFRNSKPQSSDYFYFRPGSDACRAWYEVCCTCIFIRVLFPFTWTHIDQGWFLLNVIKSFSFLLQRCGVQYVDVDDIIEAPSLSQTLSRQFVFPLRGELFCSLYFIMWWILWIRLILLSAGFIITLRYEVNSWWWKFSPITAWETKGFT